MNIGSFCRRDVVAIDQGSSLQSAAQLMRDEHVGALVVTASSPRGPLVTGVITDRDLAIDGVARGLDVCTTPVAEVAASRAVAIPAVASVADAIVAMRDEGVRRLLVTNSERELMGLVSMDDLLHAVASEMNGLAEAVRQGIARETVERPSLQETSSADEALHVPADALAGAWRSTPTP